MSLRLSDKRCLIVGGTGGIGRAAARLFQAEGARLVLAGLTAEPFDAVPVLACDATRPDQVETLFQQALSLLGGLDILYHVAGASGRRAGDGPLHDCTDAGWHATLDANLTSTFLTNRAAVRHFLARRQPGVILNMASALILTPSPHHFDTIAYTAAKGGVVALT